MIYGMPQVIWDHPLLLLLSVLRLPGSSRCAFLLYELQSSFSTTRPRPVLLHGLCSPVRRMMLLRGRRAGHGRDVGSAEMALQHFQRISKPTARGSKQTPLERAACYTVNC